MASQHVHCVERFYTGNTAKQGSEMQCLQSRFSERRKLPCDVTFKKYYIKEHKKFLARGQKDERNRQKSLLESFQKQGKLPADNVKAKDVYTYCTFLLFQIFDI